MLLIGRINPSLGIGGGGGSLAVSSSDTTPSFGQSVTITATPTGIVPTSYEFEAVQGSESIIFATAQAGNTANWVVAFVGAFEIRVLATDETDYVYGSETSTAASTMVGDSIATAPVAGFSWARRMSINYLGNAMLVRESVGGTSASIGFLGEDVDSAAIVSHVGVGNGFNARVFDQFGSNNPEKLTAADQPTIAVSGTVQLLNGKPTVVFDGATDEMSMSNITFAHAFIVAKKASDTNGGQYLLGATGGGVNFGGTLATSIGVYPASGSLVSAVTDTNPHQVSIKLAAAGAGTLRIDGAVQATGTTSANMVISRIGTRPDVPLRFIGSCSELLFYTNNLSDPDALIIENNQRAYYGL
jgi:hypothetical protein